MISVIPHRGDLTTLYELSKTPGTLLVLPECLENCQLLTALDKATVPRIAYIPIWTTRMRDELLPTKHEVTAWALSEIGYLIKQYKYDRLISQP